jgi:hypothetical protein
VSSRHVAGGSRVGFAMSFEATGMRSMEKIAGLRLDCGLPILIPAFMLATEPPTIHKPWST